MNEKQDNKHLGWRQGRFVDSPKYKDWSDGDKRRADFRERLCVRPSPTGNAICSCGTPADAAWIAERLNLAAKLEALVANPLKK